MKCLSTYVVILYWEKVLVVNYTQQKFVYKLNKFGWNNDTHNQCLIQPTINNFFSG